MEIFKLVEKSGFYFSPHADNKVITDPSNLKIHSVE